MKTRLLLVSLIPLAAAAQQAAEPPQNLDLTQPPDVDIHVPGEPPADQPEWKPDDDLAALEALWLEELSPYGERGYNRPPRDS